MSTDVDVLISKCRELTINGLIPFIEAKVQEEFGNDWPRRAGCRIVNGQPHWDLQALLKVIVVHWNDMFNNALPSSARGLAFELKDWRNHVAHDHEMSLDDADRAIGTAARLLKAIGAPQAEEVEHLKLAVMQAQIHAANVRQLPAPSNHQRRLRDLTQDVDDSSQSDGAPSWFHCVQVAAQKLGAALTRKAGRCVFSLDRKYGVCCIVSKEYPNIRYWWTIHDRQFALLEQADEAYVALGCGSPPTILLVPASIIKDLTPQLNPKTVGIEEGWHLHVQNEMGRWWLLAKGRHNRVEITRYVI